MIIELTCLSFVPLASSNWALGSLHAVFATLTMLGASLAVAGHPACAGVARPAQLISLRAFSPCFQTPGRQPCMSRREWRRRAATGLEVLQGAQPLSPQPSPLLEVEPDRLPSYEEWHSHPELLRG